MAVEDGTSTDEDKDDADHADNNSREGRDPSDARHGPRDVAKQPVRSACEHDLLAFLRRVGLDDANAAQRLSQTAGDFCVDLTALAEERPQPVKGERHRAPKRAESQQRDRGQSPVQVEEHTQRNHCRYQTADELHQSGSDEISNALSVGHDARDEYAGLR